MAGQGRLNKVIELLGRGEVVFSCGTIPNGNYDEIMALSQSSYDLIVLETEHVGLTFPPCGTRCVSGESEAYCCERLLTA